MAKTRIDKPYDLDDNRLAYLTAYAAIKKTTVDAMVKGNIDTLVASAEVYAYSAWWDSLSHDQKLALYNANK